MSISIFRSVQSDEEYVKCGQQGQEKRPGGQVKTCQNEAGTQEKENPISEELKRKTDQIMGKLRGQATLTSNPADHRGRGGQNGGQIGGKVHMF